MTRILTHREQSLMLSPWKEAAMPPVTLFSKPDCPQCMMTKKVLADEGIPHQVRDVTQDPDAHAFVTGLGYSAAPVVHAGDDNHWSGFRPDLIRGLRG
jgi:glutaredoxin-like protein NrdH